MFRHTFFLAGSIALLVFAGTRTPVQAQVGPYGRSNFGPMSRPTMGPSANPVVSPYINLSGRNPVVNYYGIIRPQLEARSLELQQGQTLQQLDRRLRGEEAKTQEVLTLPRTGHRSYFLNYSHYYPGSRQ